LVSTYCRTLQARRRLLEFGLGLCSLSMRSSDAVHRHTTECSNSVSQQQLVDDERQDKLYSGTMLLDTTTCTTSPACCCSIVLPSIDVAHRCGFGLSGQHSLHSTDTTLPLVLLRRSVLNMKRSYARRDQATGIHQLVVLMDYLEAATFDGFCIYRCLKREDRHAFLLQLLSQFGSLVQCDACEDSYRTALAYLLHGGVKMAAWTSIMENCVKSGVLKNSYVLYVPAEDGPVAIRQFLCPEETDVANNVNILWNQQHLDIISEEDLRNASQLEAKHTSYLLSVLDTSKKQQLMQLQPHTHTSSPHVSSYVFGSSIPSAREHEDLIAEFRGSPIVAKFKNADGKNHALLQEQVLMDIFTTLRAKLTSRFSFVNCLHADDQAVFAQQLIRAFQEKACSEQMSVEEVLARVASGGIPLQMWSVVMTNCAALGLLRNNYALYRRAYWGENSGQYSDTTLYSFYHCQVQEFVTTRADGDMRAMTDAGMTAILFDGYGHLSQLSDWFLNPSANIDPHRQILLHTIVY
jgi:hypothetical protein